MRPLLRPGAHVLDRGDGHLQVGLDPAGAVVLPDRPDVRALLAGLDGSEHSGPATHPVLDLLVAEDVVVDEQAVLPLLASPPAGGQGAVAALARHLGADAPAAATRRRATRLDLRGFGPEIPGGAPGLLCRLRELTAQAGLGEPLPDAAPPPSDRPVGVLGVLAGIGQPDRELADPWTQAGTPYVVVRVTEGRAVVGPFVVPGETACLRCIDAHHTDADRAWPLLVHQYARATSAARPGGVAEPVDPILVALAAAWAARDLVSHADGVRPSTWSATLVLDAALGAVETHCWLRHPECGCSWR